MNNNVFKKKILLQIYKVFSYEFLLSLEENVTASFAKAQYMTNINFAIPEQKLMLGQNRHALCEESFRDTAKKHGY